MQPALFWTIATIMSGLTTAAILIPLFWRRDGEDSERPNKKRIWAAAGLTVLMPLLALGAYSVFGTPESLTYPSRTNGETPVANSADAHAAGAMPGGREGGDLTAAVERLKRKLTDNPQDSAGWALLAQSYEFAGDAALAADAREKVAQIAAGRPVTPPATDVAAAALAMMNQPPSGSAAGSLAERAEMHRRKREFSQALVAFAELARTQAMSADLWADYADAHGAAQGKLDRTSADYIAKALAMNPKHVKALWLLGSYQTDTGDFRGALATWEKLATLLPRDSSDYTIINANLAEARERAAAAPAQAVQVVSKSGAVTPAASSARIRGVVDLADKFKSRVASGSTLYILARAVDSPGPPLAVMRVAVVGWPMRFELNDSQSMIPTRTLSQFPNVIVEARISRKGDAQARAGDLRGVSAPVDARVTSQLQLTIADEIT